MTRKFKKDFLVDDKEYSYIFAEHIPEHHPKPDDYIKASTGSFEDEENIRAQYFYPYLKKDAWLLDVGAGFGSYTLPALAFGMQVLAFSPEAEWAALQENLKLNNFSCILSATGLYDKVGFYHPPTNSFSETKENQDMIIVAPFREYTLTRYHYIKIDVEGADLPVLRGMEQTIRKDKPYLLVENHQFIRKEYEPEIISYIDSLDLGYKHETMPYHAISFTLFSPQN